MSLTHPEQHDVLRGELLAIDEVNADGGVQGVPCRSCRTQSMTTGLTLYPLIMDGQSQTGASADMRMLFMVVLSDTHLALARQAVANPQIKAIFSGGSSVLRKEVSAIVQASDKVPFLTT